MQFWLAGKFGQLWLAVHKGLRPALGECALAARGVRVPAGRLYRVEAFAAHAWWRAAMAAALLVFPVIGMTAVLRPARAGTDAGTGLIFALGCLAGVAMLLQMGLLSFRSGVIRLYLVKAGPGAEQQPLPPGSRGWPTRWEFWVMTIIGAAAFGILLYAATRSPHH